MSMTSSTICPTPATTTPDIDFQAYDDTPSFKSVPTVGSWFIIRERLSGGYLSVINGKPLLRKTRHHWGGYRWCCTKLNGWFGLCEWTSGRFIGRDGNDKVVARAPKQGHEQCIAISHQADGGYHISIFHTADTYPPPQTYELLPLKVDGDAQLLVLGSKRRTALWDFEQIEPPPQ
ncbi:dynamin family protein [Fusarium langsethiae]|uniref:Dynamin family protein n=1 Tax=Fusarium langsethiae TaxID=179993 RepID=A0A0N0DB46_FUSLA|nr:dynamin family protein [Fusarium langsethiae]